MADDPAITPKKVRSKGGRPSRAEASARALSGIDIANLDPVAVLRSIAADKSQPGSTRVQACRALLALPDADAARAVAHDAVTARAIEILAGRRGN